MEEPSNATPSRSEPRPSGVVTFVFTDVEGSTALAQRAGPLFPDLLERHRQIVREALARHSGSEVDTAGDGFFVVFVRASDAVRFALETQLGIADEPWPDGLELRIRIGIHTGEAAPAGNGYVGLVVHEAARVSSAGYGGQILISQTTKDLVGRGADGEVSVRDLGEHGLRGIPGHHRLFQLVHPKLQNDFPPLKTSLATHSNLPPERSSFIEREGELAQLESLVESSELVTLTGPGGSGKTRLALKLADRLQSTFTRGVWWVELNNVTEPADVASFVATSMGLSAAGSDPDTALATIVEFVRDEAGLLVLDNCEHVVAPVVSLIEALLQRCRSLRVIATSREVLGLPGEGIWRVPPLAYPDPARPTEVEAAKDFPAITLFTERGSRVQPGFRLDESNTPAIVKLCARLDGIPLGIELAAAKLRHLTPQQIASGLDDMFRMLGGSRSSVSRQQTLDAAINWSYGLITPGEQALFITLGVFRGSFDAAAAASVSFGDEAQTEELLYGLVDRSLVEIHSGSDQPRFRLIEAMRQFAEKKLVDGGEMEVVRRRHASYFHELARRWGASMFGANATERLLQFRHDWENVIACADFILERDGPGNVFDIVSQMLLVGLCVGNRSGEGWSRLERALEAYPEPSPSRAEALSAGAMFAMAAGAFDEVVKATDEVLPILRSPSDSERDPKWLFLALCSRGEAEAMMGNTREAEPLLAEATRIAEAAGSAPLLGFALIATTSLAVALDEGEAAREMLARAIRLYLEPRNELWLGLARFQSGLLEMRLHNPKGARPFYQASLPTLQKLENYWYQWALDHLAAACFDVGDHEAARAYCEEGIKYSREHGFESGNYSSLLNTLALVHELGEDWDQARTVRHEMLTRVRDSGRPMDLPPALVGIGDVERRRGNLAAARGHLLEALQLACELEPQLLSSGFISLPPVAASLEGLADLAIDGGSGELACELLGAAEAQRERDQRADPRARPLSERHLRNHHARLERLEKLVGPQPNAAWTQGRQLTAEEALAKARAEVPSSPRPAPA